MTARLPESSHVGRVALRVNDLDRAVEFYRSVVGLELLERGDDGATLGAGDDPLLELLAEPDAPERPRAATGLFHVAVRFPTRAALGDALSRVEAAWELTGASDHLVSEALYLSDPEGNGVELYCDRPRDDWPVEADGSVGMETLPLDLESIRADATGESRAPAGTAVGHVHLEVSSIPAAEAFYDDALGLDVRARYADEASFLAAGGYHHHVGANVWNGRTDPPSGRGLAWWELRVPGDAIASSRERLAAAGYESTPTDGGFRVSDPDGIPLRVVADASADGRGRQRGVSAED